MAWRTNALGGWIVGLLLLAACTSDPEQVVSGDDTGSGESAITETTTVGSSALPVPSQWWLIDDGGAQTQEAISFFNAGNDGLLTVAFTDGCVRSAERLAEPGSYEIVGPVENDAVCVTWFSEPFFVGAQFAATVDGGRIAIEIGDLRIDGVAIESVSDPEPVSPTTTVVSAESTLVTTTFGPEVWINPLTAVIDDFGGRWLDVRSMLDDVEDVEDVDQEEIEAIVRRDRAEWEPLVPADMASATCKELLDLVRSMPEHGGVAADDRARSHTILQMNSDLGSLAATVADGFGLVPDRCTPSAIDELGLERGFEIGPMVVGPVATAFALTLDATDASDEQTSWTAVLHRNNVLSIVQISEVGSDELTFEDLPDFARVVQLAFDALAEG